MVIEKAVPAVADGLRTMAEVIQTGQATTAVGLEAVMERPCKQYLIQWEPSWVDAGRLTAPELLQNCV